MAQQDEAPRHVDVIIVGAGLSGVGAACHLRRECPQKSIMVLEGRSAIGGTWDLFSYPGVRSDSDMFTLGYDFRPWSSTTAIADGGAILRYIRETATEYGIDALIRFDHRVISADWSSTESRWTVRARHGDQEVVITCSFLLACSGYYRYDQGYTPELPGLADFGGRAVHPQLWPADLDCADRAVVIIGSGATAVTLAPALAERGAHVTMVQRSPTYIAVVPSHDRTAETRLRRWPRRWAYGLVRWKHVLTGIGSYRLSRSRPERMKALLRAGARHRLPPDFDLDTHLAPTYDPWDQRLCAAPDGDFFEAIAAGTVELVTDRIEQITPTGLRLGSGREVGADVIITATGLNLQAVGGVALSLDGVPVDLAEQVAYKGMMVSGVPNFALTLGYTNASWTLKADLVARYVGRLLRRLDATGAVAVTPVRPPDLDPGNLSPLIDLRSGYVLRSVDLLPKQGPRAPWRLHQNYLRDLLVLRFGRLTDGVVLTAAGRRVPATEHEHERERA